jgi:hypothetical protein
MNPSDPMHTIEVKRLRRASSLLNVRRRNLRISITIPFSGDVGVRKTTSSQRFYRRILHL